MRQISTSLILHPLSVILYPLSLIPVHVDFSAVVIAMLAIYALITNPLLLFVMVSLPTKSDG